MNNCLIHIIDAKIQRQRLKDMKEAAKKRKINTTDSFGPEVTHIVTEFRDIGSVLRKLGKATVEELGDVQIVSLSWFTDCMRAGHVVPVLEIHKIQTTPESMNSDGPAQRTSALPEYACQRATPLEHCNKKFTDALEVLELHAELRDDTSDYSRALAFRRASCVLKALPYTLSNIRQLRQVTNIGGHSLRVIQEILEEGSSSEVDDILRDQWFQKMKLFSSIFGIGTSKAKKFIENGWSTIKDAQDAYKSSDWRVQWGLAFHEELNTPVCRVEADYILSQVRQHVDKILPGVVLELTGGFRRGKPSGHDVDVLLTHPVLGKEKGLLPRLLNSLQSHDIILYGNGEKNSYSDDVLTTDYKLTMKGQLDHFEKWIGIMKVPKSVYEQAEKAQNTATVVYNRIDEKRQLNSECVLPSEVSVENNCPEIPVEGSQNGTLSFEDKDENSTKDYSRLTQEEITKLSREPRDWIARRVDLIVSPYDQYFYALVGWTGNKMFNRDLRWYADREMNMKLTSHGLYDKTKGRKLPASSEEEVFQHLQIPYRNPSDRNC